jgi:hypothetical protein
MEKRKKGYARLPIAEKLAIAARLREVQERLAPLRAANKVKQSTHKVKIRIKTA